MASMYFFALIAFCSVIFFNDEVKAGACGGIFEETSGVITSPGYPAKYPPNNRCTYEIKIPTNNRIGLRFRHFRMQGCYTDYLTIRSRLVTGAIRDLMKICTFTKDIILSDSNNLLIEFISNPVIEFEGFELEYFTVYSQCGAVIADRKGAITSPQYNRIYNNNENCTWTIEAQPNQSIQLNFEKFSLEPQDNCNFDYVTVKSNITRGEVIKYREHGKFCGSQVPPVVISESNILLVQFVSDRNTQNKGFLAVFSAEECGGLVEGDEGRISTPFYPNSYPANKVCEWTITVPSEHKLKLRFLDFEIEEGDNCTSDFLLVERKTPDNETHEYGKYCGDSKPPLIISSRDTVILKFVSDRRTQGRGFLLEYFIDTLSDYEKSIIETSTVVTETSTVVTETSTVVTEPENNEMENFISENEHSLSVRRLLTSKDIFLKDGR